jgi:hypothetical protein
VQYTSLLFSFFLSFSLSLPNVDQAALTFFMFRSPGMSLGQLNACLSSWATVWLQWVQIWSQDSISPSVLHPYRAPAQLNNSFTSSPTPQLFFL